MSSRAFRLLSAAAVLLFNTCHAGSFIEAAPNIEEPVNLRPIHLRDYESALGIHRRSGEEFNELHPSDKSQLIWGNAGENGQLLFANMTLYAPDGLPIVMMERFEGLTAGVDCKGDDGAMSLTFKSRDAYDYAMDVWQYINEDDDKQFLLIANHDGCGPDDERQPYKVSNVMKSSKDLTIGMKTTTTQWSEVAGTYDLDLGKASLSQSPQRLKPRGFFGDIVDVGKTVLQAAQGNFDESLPVNFNVNVGTPGQKTNIYTDSKGRFAIDCIDCYVTGSWQVEGHVKVSGFKLEDLTLSAAPSNFKAKLELEATVTASKTPVSLSESKELFAAPIPGAGIAVTGIFKLGATVSYTVGTSATFAGTATADFGLSAGLPNGAKVVANVNDPSKSSATGWQASSLTPVFEVKKLDSSLTLAAFSQPKVAFGIELTEVGKVDIAVTMKLPEISSTLSATWDAAGACPPSASKTGVKLENKATESLSLAIDVDLGADNTKPSWSKTLLDFSQPLGGQCIPLSIPELAASKGGTATSKPPATGPTSAAVAPPPAASTCKPPGKTGVCQSTSKACAGGAYIAGYCPGDASIKCCPDAAGSTPSTPAPSTCSPPGKTGICQSTSKACAGGAYIAGYCPGDASIKCCPDASSSTTPPATCSPPGKTGICQSTSKACAGGAYIAGYCPGDASIKCCPNAPASGGGCRVRRDRMGRRVVAC
ncbi:MAG: hypothetical protein Q9219_006376 [cf. Caloplaca sp. 3 TL-2023]